MAEGSLLPFFRNRLPALRVEDLDPLRPLRREMDRLFDGFFAGLAAPPAGGDSGRILTPDIDVSENDREIRIAAELPGIDEKDIEVTVAEDMLTIRGEKKEERERKERDYHLMERSYGTFSRTLRLPFAVDAGQATAVFKDGVLKITIPKPQEVLEKTRKIAVRREDGGSQPAAQPAAPQAQQAGEREAPQPAAE
jgi:HSP20 family protein